MRNFPLSSTRPLPIRWVIPIVTTALGLPFAHVRPAQAKQTYRDAFFAVYPNAVGSAIDTVPSHPNHCGVCHYQFGGGGPRNPYGIRFGQVVGDFPNNPTGRQQAVLFIENEDSDGDGYSTVVEVTDTISFSNTPTFPGLTSDNVGNAAEVDPADIQEYLTPTTGIDTTPPEVTVTYPDGGETILGNAESTVSWLATDDSMVAWVDVYLSDDGGFSFKPLALSLENSGSLTWYAPNRPTTQALIRVAATDIFSNTGQDDSDQFLTIEAPPGGLAPTTLRDFDQPGSQPFEAGILNDPAQCVSCHGGYDPAVEPYFNWQGSMMAHASRDPLFVAGMVVANQDAPDSGDLCLRCHMPTGWLAGRSVPTDGSQMLETDKVGVSCDFCHRQVDPFFDPAENPAEDEGILTGLTLPPEDLGNGQYVLDPTGTRRGPFEDADIAHATLVSPFHRDAAICGNCHDVSNPAFENDGAGNYLPNEFDASAETFSPHSLLPIERTYSEWFYSDYNTAQGVFAPQFAGNLDPPNVGSCQDCHMRDITGQGCFFGPVRDDLPLHDMTGGSTWLPSLLPDLYPEYVEAAPIQAAIIRAQYMLQNAADLEAAQDGENLTVTVTNNTGHKLPAGYPEGRRMWINVKFHDPDMNLLTESGAYDPVTGMLINDAEIQIYEAKPGLDEVTAPLAGVDPGPSFHFVLNNKIYKDNRIPPRGFANAEYESFGGQPVGHTYADGQYWDEASYTIPPGAAQAEITLYYQSISKEFVEFLRDENSTNDAGQQMFDLWNDNGKCPPNVMQTTIIALEAPCPADLTEDGAVGAEDLAQLLGAWGPNPGHPADFDGDGFVGAADLAQLLGAWGPC